MLRLATLLILLITSPSYAQVDLGCKILLRSDLSSKDIETSSDTFGSFLQKWSQNIPPYLETTARLDIKGKKASARKWVQDLKADHPNKEHILFDKPLAPNAPEFSLYNWEEEINFENLTQGVSVKNLNALVKKSRLVDSGLYGATHPLSSITYGSILMEVVVYKDKYPVKQHDGSVKMKPIKPHQIMRDSLGETWDNSDISSQYGLPHNYFVVYDLAVIKELRWPPKDFIKGMWESVEYAKLNPLKMISIMSASTQWVFSPNYTKKERARLFRSSPTKLSQAAEHLAGPGRDFSYPFSKKRKNINSDELFINGILKTVLNSNKDFINLRTGEINLPKAYRAFLKLSGEAREALQIFLRSSDSKSRIFLFLRLFIEIENGSSFDELFSPFKKFYKNNKKKNDMYIHYDSRRTDAEEDHVKAFIKSFASPNHP